MTSRLIIINADDFGASSGVNAAIERVRKFGLLTSASLMVTGDAMEEAVNIARDDPKLAVGLHLAISNAKSVLPTDLVPDLVDGNSRFGNNPVSCAWHYYFSRRAKNQLRAEIEAQFEAFIRTGLLLSHVDGHQHLHAHPAVLPIVIELAKQYGAKGIRIPREPYIENIRADRKRIIQKTVTALGHTYLRRWMPRCELVSCHYSIGGMMSGAMTVDYVINILESVRADMMEVFFHPCAFGPVYPQGPNPGDMEALLSPALKEFIASSGFTPVTYADIERYKSRFLVVPPRNDMNEEIDREGEAPAEPEENK